ncbi:MAG TPA: hypothetical protein VHP11_12775 [Tepidisphaeraceae bacterium]|nr:hypothetical protein [Tepidisphaeraceae bacterium]
MMARGKKQKKLKTPPQASPPPGEQRTEEQVRNNAFSKIGPQSIAGVEASDLPDKRGSVDTDPGKELRRALPQSTGGTIGGEVGMRGEKPMIESDEFGG